MTTPPDAVAPRFSWIRNPDGRTKAAAVIFVVAFMCRLLPALLGGGLAFYGRYDDGVYYTAADALTFGRIPYKQFILLHPPGIMLVLSPFALLGRLTTDALGLSVARLAFMGIGGLNAVLVTLIAYRWGKWQGILAGLMYAGWSGALYSETATMLEPLGGTALLVALLLLLRRENGPSVKAQYLAGAALGLACAMKIWYVVPWAVVVIYQLAARRYRCGLRMVIGGAIPLAVVLTPFFIMAPTRMYDLVVRDQVLRRVSTTSRVSRLTIIFGMKNVVAHHGPVLYLATALMVGLTAIAALACIWERSAGLIVAALAGNLFVLYWSPSFFRHYSALTAAPIILVTVIGIGILVRQLSSASLGRPVVVVALAVLTAMAINNGTTKTGKVFPAKFKAAAPAGCITADDPTALIDMNRLSSDLGHGCRVPVDVSGITYDSLRDVLPNGTIAGRGHNLGWQEWLYNYLTSGSAFILIRQPFDVIPPSYRPLYRAQPLIAAGQHLRLRRGFGST